jgi:hypothetical protein
VGFGFDADDEGCGGAVAPVVEDDDSDGGVTIWSIMEGGKASVSFESMAFDFSLRAARELSTTGTRAMSTV